MLLCSHTWVAQGWLSDFTVSGLIDATPFEHGLQECRHWTGGPYLSTANTETPIVNPNQSNTEPKPLNFAKSHSPYPNSETLNLILL